MSKVKVIRDLGSRSLGLNVHQNFKYLLFRNQRANLSQILFRLSMPHGKKDYIIGHGHMTKMAAMPIYGETLKQSSPEPHVIGP